MRAIVLAVSSLWLLSSGVSAATFEEMLLRLDFEERADQVCVKLGVETIRRDGHLPGADRLMTSTVGSRAVVKGDFVVANHAAVRGAHSLWYELKFNCKVSPDHTKAYSFEYKIGAEIPKAQWQDLGLWQH